MSKNLITILFLTLVTIVGWVAFQVFKVTSQSTISQPDQKLIEPLDPNLDSQVLEDLKGDLH